MPRHKYLIEIIQVTEKKHVHLEKRTDDLFLTAEIPLDDSESKNEVKIEPKDLYEVPHGLVPSILFRLQTGQIKHYLMVVNKDGVPIKEVSPKISGKVLRVARDWKGLDKAISDSFGSDLPMGRIAMLIGVVAMVGIVAFLIWKGFIPIPGEWGI